MLRYGTALAVLLLLAAPVVGRVTQHLGRGAAVRHQLTFSRAGERPPARVEVARPVTLPEPGPVLSQDPPRRFPVSEVPPFVSTDFVAPLDELRGPPPAAIL